MMNIDADLIRLSSESTGSTEGLSRYRLKSGQEVFTKPDPYGELYIAEKNYLVIANFFGLPCCKVQSRPLKDGRRLCSYKEPLKRYFICNSFELETRFQSYEYTLKGFEKVLNAEAFKTICNVVYVDAICKHMDRHQGNLSFIINNSGFLLGVYPMYDNVDTFTRSVTECALLGVDNNRVYTHQEMIRFLRQEGLCSEQDRLVSSPEFRQVIRESEFAEFLSNRIEHLFIQRTSLF